jgi:hypothetical protein|tara:strand:- start:4206 stop:4715 length:510 start_codon:yes stop_codon:yes gene_type:complete
MSRILTLENKAFNLNELPDEVEEDARFSVLDNSDASYPDFYFMPLIFLESFNSPAILMNIGGYEIQMPLDWCMLVGDSDCGTDPEVLPLTSINERGFEAFVINPIKGYRSEFAAVEIINIYQDVRWYFPKMKNGQLLSVPLHDGDNPLCAYFVKEISRQSEQVELANLL